VGGSHDPAFGSSDGSLPSGTVTFLFTDIEGSTVRWERDREAMQAAVRRHDALLHEVLAAHGGRVFKTIGDAFCAAFSTARGALEAAAAIQRRLAAEDWSAVDGLSVRIAVHAGEADERDGDYFGPTLNRLARLLATAHGKQIVVSHAALESARFNFPEHLSLRDLGVHRLKDLREPEHIFQLIAPGLTTDFMPLRSAGSSGNLPDSATTFVGRSDDLANLNALLDEHRLVTVVGTGGVGKTRVALQIGGARREDFETPWFVDLAPLVDPAFVAPTILAVIGERADGREPLEAAIDFLAPRRVLLILDNCEHLIAEVARVADAIRARCKNVTTLATSREALNVAGERTYRLAPLELEAAVELFSDRALSVNPRFAVSLENRSTVEAICTRVDGIALAIELAASRVRAISLEELLRRLDDRFRLLTGGSRTNLPHQQTMRALIDWSYELLSSDEKKLFARLSTFAGRFTLDAATEVCASEGLDGWNVLDLLMALVDKSLVVAEGEDPQRQFRILQTLADYARERLRQDGGAEIFAARHATYFANVAERGYSEWDTAPGPDWLSRLAPDLANFRSALDRTLKLRRDAPTGARLAANVTPVFLRLSLLAEGIDWCLAALQIEPAPPLKAKLLYVLSMLYNNQLSYKSALHVAEAAVALYEGQDDHRALARALSQFAQLSRWHGNSGAAIQYADRALSLARKLNDPRLLAGTLQRCAMVFEPHEIQRARAEFAESVTLFRSLGRGDETSRALIWWATAEAEANCFERALQLSRDALELDNGSARMYILSNITAYALVLHDASQARTAAGEAFTTAAETRHPVLLPVAMSHLAALSAANDPMLAAPLFAYAQKRLTAQDWSDTTESMIFAMLSSTLDARLSEGERRDLFRDGEAWTEDRAMLCGWSLSARCGLT
jgi:predicted ATPase/class 3 adenylate cyclase